MKNLMFCLTVWILYQGGVLHVYKNADRAWMAHSQEGYFLYKNGRIVGGASADGVIFVDSHSPQSNGIKGPFKVVYK